MTVVVCVKVPEVAVTVIVEVPAGVPVAILLHPATPNAAKNNPAASPIIAGRAVGARALSGAAMCRGTPNQRV